MRADRDPHPLDGFFEGPPLAVLRAVRDLESLAPGVVERPDLWSPRDPRPARAGPLAEGVFGPLGHFECACGTVRGRGRSGERCERCGVQCASADLRGVTWGRVEVGISLLHPLLVGPIARILGWSEDDVRAVAHAQAYVEDGVARHEVDEHLGMVDTERIGETRAGGLIELLRVASGPEVDALRAEGFAPEDLIVRAVPVPPPGDRPGDRGLADRPVPSVADVSWSRLVRAAGLARRLWEIDAPFIALIDQSRAVQRAFEAAFDATVGRQAELWRAGGDPLPVVVPDAIPYAHTLQPIPHPTRPVDVALVGTDVLVRFPYALVHLDGEGVIRGVHRAAGHTVWASEEAVVFLASAGGWAGSALHVLDLRDGSWRTTLPEAFPGVVADERYEQALLVEVRTGRAVHLAEVVDYPVLVETSPDGRYVWVEDKEGYGGVYDTSTGRRHLVADRGEEAPVYVHGARLRRASAGVVAFAVSGRQLTVLDGGVVRQGGTPRLVLDGPVEAAAFSADGDTLALAARDRLDVVDLYHPDPSISRFDLRPLAAGLDPKGEGLGRKRKDALLARIGSLWSPDAPPELRVPLPDRLPVADQSAVHHEK